MQNKKILYVTSDSSDQPILSSQVYPLISELNNSENILLDLAQLKGVGKINPEESRFKSYEFKSVFNLTYFVIKNIFQYDIFHFRSYIPYIFVSPLLFLLNRVSIFDMRGVLPQEVYYQKVGAKRLFYGFILSLGEVIMVNLCTKIVVVSNPFKEYLSLKYGGRVTKKTDVITTFSRRVQGDINLNKKLNLDESKTLISFCGSLSKWQNFKSTIALYKNLAPHFENPHFVVFTKDSKAALRLLEFELPKKNYSVLFVKNSELAAHLQNCHLGILLREQNIINKVSAPIKIKDYLNSCVPIIVSSDVGDTDKYIEKYGVGIAVSNFTDKEKTQKQISKNIIILKKIMSGSKARFNHFYQSISGIEIAIEKYSLIYKSLIK